MYGFRRYPFVAEPPPLPCDLTQATFGERRRYVRYQLSVLRRLSENPHLLEWQCRAAREQAADIRSLLRAHPLLNDLSRCIEDSTGRVLQPLLLDLRDQAHAVLARDPDTAAWTILLIFAGDLSRLEKWYARRLTVPAVMERCLAPA